MQSGTGASYFVVQKSTGVVLCSTGVVLAYYFVVQNRTGVVLCCKE